MNEKVKKLKSKHGILILMLYKKALLNNSIMENCNEQILFSYKTNILNKFSKVYEKE